MHYAWNVIPWLVAWQICLERFLPPRVWIRAWYLARSRSTITCLGSTPHIWVVTCNVLLWWLGRPANNFHKRQWHFLKSVPSMRPSMSKGRAPRLIGQLDDDFADYQALMWAEVHLIIKVCKIEQILHLFIYRLEVWIVLRLLCFISLDLYLCMRRQHNVALASVLVFGKC